MTHRISASAVTPELVSALSTLRLRARGGYVSDTEASSAFNVLDNAGVFAVIDEATGYDVLEIERSEES